MHLTTCMFFILIEHALNVPVNKLYIKINNWLALSSLLIVEN